MPIFTHLRRAFRSHQENAHRCTINGYEKTSQGGRLEVKGWPEGSRTLDTRIFSPLLYQLSYLAVYVMLTCSSITISNLKRESNENFKKV